MKNYDWSTFTQRVSIRASDEAIINAWVTREGLESWFLSKAEFTGRDNSLRDLNSRVEVGDKYTWNWHGYADYVGTGEILKERGSSFLTFTFSGGSIVLVAVKHDADETICELQQIMTQESDLDKRYYYIECGKGWTFYLANLKSILEGGLDLRNKNTGLVDMINA